MQVLSGLREVGLHICTDSLKVCKQIVFESKCTKGM
jgi:hypothetical protein